MSGLEAYRSRFDADGWQVFRRTIEECSDQGQYHLSSEHIIRGLLAKDQGLFEDILKSLSVGVEAFKFILEERIKNKPQFVDRRIRLDNEVIEVLKSAFGRANAQGRAKIGNADMLMALAVDEQGALLEIFSGMSIDPLTVVDVIRDAIVKRDSPTIEKEVQHFCRKGDTIRIRTGAFAAMSGKVADVDHERSVLRVMVSIYGRPSVIELNFSDVEKVSFD